MIRLKSLCFLFFPMLFFGCYAQSVDKNELIISDFNWKLKIPDFLISENKEEWRKIQDLGRKVIAKTHGSDVINNVKTIFIFKSRDQCYFEATSEPFNNGSSFISTCERMNDIFYDSIKAQIPNAQIDTLKSVVTVDNIQFQTLTCKVVFPNGAIKHSVSFRSLFKGNELTVSIMFSNKESGNQIIDAFKKSSFSFNKDSR